MTDHVAVRMSGIAKRFGPVEALRGADFSLAPGEIHALLGENGAGKSTLMHILFGLKRADAGTVEVFGRPLPPGAPRAAIAAGIGMVHQHFSQVPRLTVAENVWLGRPGFRYDGERAADMVRAVGRDTGLVLDPAATAEQLSAGLRQRLEIVKALSWSTRVLILDEPTASLTPAEVDELFEALRRLVRRGLSIVMITHKLREIAAIATRVTVLRRGLVVMSGPAADVGAEDLARAMIGEGGVPAQPAAEASRPREASPVLTVRGLTVPGAGGQPAVDDVSFDVLPGEIVAIAAVEGNGQRELMRAVAGLERFEGEIGIGGPGAVGFIPEDRQHEGLILEMSLAENMALGAPGGFRLDRARLERDTADAIAAFGISAAGPSQPAGSLSGGNQQRVVLARVLGQRPALLVAENPARGLDVRAAADVHMRLRRAARDHGLGVLYYSTDLDEVLAIGDRIGVMHGGKWRWVDEPGARERVGALMLGTGA